MRRRLATGLVLDSGPVVGIVLEVDDLYGAIGYQHADERNWTEEGIDDRVRAHGRHDVV
jgi:hypothetical protein